MIINITPLADGRSLDFMFEEVLQLGKSYNLYDYDTKVKVNGIVSKQGTTFVCTAEVTAEVYFSCDKCLKLTTQILEFPIKEEFSNVQSINYEEEDIHYFSGTEINLKDWVISNIYFNMPMQVICDENCKGLCPRCGCNLNLGSCNCSNILYDTRFEALRSIFNNEEEV